MFNCNYCELNEEYEETIKSQEERLSKMKSSKELLESRLNDDFIKAKAQWQQWKKKANANETNAKSLRKVK